jgi:hypothetical protein
MKAKKKLLTRQVLLFGINWTEMSRLEKINQNIAKNMNFPYLVKVTEREDGHPLFVNKYDPRREEWCLIFFNYIYVGVHLKYLL